MSFIHVQTMNSLYILDDVAFTWERVIHDAKSNHLRSENGKLVKFPTIKKEEPMTMIVSDANCCKTGLCIREITTSPVVNIEKWT